MPTGSVTVSYNGNSGVVLPAVNLVNGTATVTIPPNSLWVGNDTITASYSGDTDYQQYSGTRYRARHRRHHSDGDVDSTHRDNDLPCSNLGVSERTQGDPTPTGSVESQAPTVSSVRTSN